MSVPHRFSTNINHTWTCSSLDVLNSSKTAFITMTSRMTPDDSSELNANSVKQFVYKKLYCASVNRIIFYLKFDIRLGNLTFRLKTIYTSRQIIEVWKFTLFKNRYVLTKSIWVRRSKRAKERSEIPATKNASLAEQTLFNVNNSNALKIKPQF